MIIDSSAIMAVLGDEDLSERLVTAIARAESCRLSAASLVETGIVADARSARHGERLDQLLAALEILVEPVTARQAEVARLAYRRFGRGSGSKAGLNVGDCFSYALSVTAGAPLLFVGKGFAHTDVAAQPY